MTWLLGLKMGLSSLLAIAAGWHWAWRPRRGLSAEELALAWAIGLGSATVVALVAGLCGLPLRTAAIACLFAVFAVLCIATRERNVLDERPQAADTGILVHISRVILAGSLVVLAWKVIQSPLWSWDHFAVWGVKARQILVDGHLNLDFLTRLYQTRADHPLGLPMAWLLLTFGERPDPTAFKFLHLLFAAALAAILYGAAKRVSRSTALAHTLCAALAVSPLFWDTELVGIAELPLALWALTALALCVGGHGARRPWMPGIALGFLPWIKQEGLTLGLLLLFPAAFLICRGCERRVALARLATLCGTTVTLMAGALAIQRLVLPEGATFFPGDWWGRGLQRLPMAGAILRQCASDLLQSDWLGFWVVLAGATVFAIARRRHTVTVLVAAIWFQIGIYALTAFFSYVDPLLHLQAAFFRICSALVPVGLVAMAMLLAPRPTADPEGQHDC